MNGAFCKTRVQHGLVNGDDDPSRYIRLEFRIYAVHFLLPRFAA
jgi:hypothetical protein